MKEKEFYKICDKVDLASEQIPKEMQNFYPTKESIDEHLKFCSVEQLAPVLIYIAGNPLKDIDRDENPKYVEAVSYANELISGIEFKKG